MYLSSEENDRLLTSIRALSAPGSRLFLEHVPKAGARPRPKARPGHVEGAGGVTWRSTVDAPLVWLEDCGWTAELVDARGVADALGRELPAILDPEVAGESCAWLIRAEPIGASGSSRPTPSGRIGRDL